jgi:hypothetical protein
LLNGSGSGAPSITEATIEVFVMALPQLFYPEHTVAPLNGKVLLELSCPETQT